MIARVALVGRLLALIFAWVLGILLASVLRSYAGVGSPIKPRSHRWRARAHDLPRRSASSCRWRLRNRGRAPKKPPAPGEGLRMHAVGAARRAILAMRKSGEIGDVAFHRLEEEMDRIELSAT